MIILNILIVNPDEKQSSEWKARLEKSGFKVQVQPDLQGMVFTVSRKKIHIVLCSSHLIKSNAHTVLRGVMEFFPRVKIVVIGNIPLQTELSKLQNVVIKSSFDCQLRELFGFPDNDHDIDRDDALRLLLGEHFLSSGEAKNLLERIAPNWTPDFAVISLIIDSSSMFIMRILAELKKELEFCAALKMNASEICVIIDRCPSVERCLHAADTVRSHLLQRTDAGFSIGVSRSRTRADELFACRKESLRAARASHLYGRDSVIHIDFLDDNDIWYVYPYHKEVRLVERTLDGDSNGALRLLDDLFLFLGDRADLKKHYVNKVAMRIWAQLNLAAASRLDSFETAHRDSMPFGKLLTSKSQDNVYDFLKCSIVEMAEEMREMSDVCRDALFVRLSDIRDEGGEITLSRLTKEFRTSISFINDAITRNSRRNIFDFFREGEDTGNMTE